jgi:hypothetical protein
MSTALLRKLRLVASNAATSLTVGSCSQIVSNATEGSQSIPEENPAQAATPGSRAAIPPFNKLGRKQKIRRVHTSKMTGCWAENAAANLGARSADVLQLPLFSRPSMAVVSAVQLFHELQKPFRSAQVTT